MPAFKAREGGVGKGGGVGGADSEKYSISPDGYVEQM